MCQFSQMRPQKGQRPLVVLHAHSELVTTMATSRPHDVFVERTANSIVRIIILFTAVKMAFLILFLIVSTTLPISLVIKSVRLLSKVWIWRSHWLAPFCYCYQRWILDRTVLTSTHSSSQLVEVPIMTWRTGFSSCRTAQKDWDCILAWEEKVSKFQIFHITVPKK